MGVFSRVRETFKAIGEVIYIFWLVVRLLLPKRRSPEVERYQKKLVTGLDRISDLFDQVTDETSARAVESRVIREIAKLEAMMNEVKAGPHLDEFSKVIAFPDDQLFPAIQRVADAREKMLTIDEGLVIHYDEAGLHNL